MAGERWSRERINEALGIINYLKLPVLEAVKPLRGIAYARCHEEKDYRVALLEIGLPRSRPLLIVMGVVLERSRPVSPSRLLSRLRRVYRARSRGAPQGDVVYYIVLGRGSRLTSGAEKLARRLRSREHVYVASHRSLRTELGRYLLARLRRFLESVRGKKLYGGLEHLPLALLRLAEAVTKVPEALRTQALRAAM